MKARFFLSVIVLLLAFSVKGLAQDLIHTMDGQAIEAKVLQITDQEVRYKTFDNLEGPDYLIPIGRVERIVFENGTEKLFTLNDHFGPLAYRWGSFYDNRGRLYSDQIRDYLGVTLYGSQYRKARNQFQWGTGLTVGGAVLMLGALAGGGMYTYFNNRWGTRTALTETGEPGGAINSSGAMLGIIAAGVAGAVCVGVGIPLWVKGDRKLNDIADDYNRQYGPGPSASLTLGSTSNGFGLALRF